VRPALTGARDATRHGASRRRGARCGCWLLPLRNPGRATRTLPTLPKRGQRAGQPPPPRAHAAAADTGARAPLLLASKAEALRTFADPMAIDRADDDRTTAAPRRRRRHGH
jgi:hypothetical protein